MTAINRMERMNSSHYRHFSTLCQTHHGFQTPAEETVKPQYYNSTGKRTRPWLDSYWTQTRGTLLPVVGLLTPPIFNVIGIASPLMCAPGMRQLIW